ncbi:MAG: HDOD domain-containing protein [Acidobacteria bacterium]|nr:MAG: HDOD domain-containing protein [Acidobacteriota bacterium]
MSRAVAAAGWRLRIEEALRREELRLPVMPDIVARVQLEAARRNGSAGSLARVVEADPGLAARVVKMANSAMFAGLCEIRDLTHAVGRLGSGMVVAIVLGAAARECFRAAHPGYARRAHDSWEISLLAAAAARSLALRAGEDPEEAFLAGLLHRAGEPILLQAVPLLAERDGEPVPPAETIGPVVDELAPVAGATLLSRWNLPEPIVTAVRFQNDPAAAPREDLRRTALTALARRLGEALFAGEGAEALTGDPSAAALGLDEEAIAAAAPEAAAGAGELARAL